MLEFYDSSPYTLYTQQTRLKSAFALSKAQINFLVWGYDALAYIHFIPTNLCALHLSVADKDVQQASTEIMKCLPYKLCTSIPDSYIEFIFFNPTRPMQFPHSVHLEWTSPKGEIDDPDMIFIHPQSQLYLDVHDKSRSVSLPSFPDTIRFPTRTAFIDSMIEISLDPPTSQINTRMKEMLSVWMSYFLLYTLRTYPRVLPNGELEPECAEVLQSLRPENQPYFKYLVTDRKTLYSERIVYAMRRKDVLEKLGKHEEARRPLPLPLPGNPEFWAQRRANRQFANQKRSYLVSAFRGTRSTITKIMQLIR